MIVTVKFIELDFRTGRCDVSRIRSQIKKKETDICKNNLKNDQVSVKPPVIAIDTIKTIFYCWRSVRVGLTRCCVCAENVLLKSCCQRERLIRSYAVEYFEPQMKNNDSVTQLLFL